MDDFLTFLIQKLKADKPSTVITVDYLLKVYSDYQKAHTPPPPKPRH